MYLAWSMTYFHINLDPRGKKKSFAANSYTRDYIGVLFCFVSFCFFFFFSLNLLGSVFFFSERAFKDTSSGRNVGDHSAIRGPRVPPLGFGFRLCRPAESPLRGGLPSSSACTVIFRCSVLTPMLFQNTSVECVSLCAQEHTPFNIVPACLPALSTSVVMSPTCFDRTLPVFIYNSVVFISLLCVYVHVSLFSIYIVQCKCTDPMGMENFVGVLKEPHISKKATWELNWKERGM